jgi:hypothetical protein
VTKLVNIGLIPLLVMLTGLLLALAKRRKVAGVAKS